MMRGCELLLLLLLLMMSVDGQVVMAATGHLCRRCRGDRHPLTVMVTAGNCHRTTVWNGVGSGGRRSRLDEEWLERIADLVAHVRVGEVEAGQNYGTQLFLAGHLQFR